MAEESDDDFTPAERRELRHILVTQQRTAWLWATLRVWSMWIAGIIAAIYALLTFLKDGLKALIGGTS